MGPLDPFTFTSRGDYAPQIASVLPGNTAFGPSVHSRACFTVPEGVSSLHFNLTALNDSPAFNTLRINCDDTTLIGGYNTAAGEFNFLEITNRTNGVINIRIRGYSEPAGGAQVIDSFVAVEPSAGGTKRVDFDIHSLVEPGAFGALKITHDGPAGSISAAVSQYKVLSTNPLDFTLAGRVPFEASSK